MNYDFDTKIDRHYTDSLKWDKYRGRDIIPLWVADMDFSSPPAVIGALNSRVEHGIFGYGTRPGSFIEVVCNMLSERYGWNIRPEWLILLPGLVSGLNVACRSVGKENDAVLSMVPIYPPFLTAPGHSNRELVTVPMKSSEIGWEIDFALLEQSITQKTKLILFCNPHNPVGRVFDRQELADLVSLCTKKDIIICSDEIHCDLILDPDKVHIPIASISPEAADRTITLMAPSKTFNIPGLGCSFAVISNSTMRRNFLRAMSGIVPEVNILGFVAAEAAYRKGWDWLQALLEYLRENSRLVEDEIGAVNNLHMHHVEATYLAWIDAREIDAKYPGRYFEAHGVGLSEGSEFGYPGFVRLNFGCQRELLQEALKRLKRAAAG
jgi:cystathionine beta-lyase